MVFGSTRRIESEYQMAEAVRLRGKLNLPALDRAVKTLIERHESLRTRFGEAAVSPSKSSSRRVAMPSKLRTSVCSKMAREKRPSAATLRRELKKPFRS